MLSARVLKQTRTHRDNVVLLLVLAGATFSKKA